MSKAHVDWALELPGKFMSRLFWHLPNKDLANFAMVCKSWHIRAQPLLKKKHLDAVEAKILDFRLSRKIYDAKRKVRAFIQRDPNTMNSAQIADLARSKQLLEQANLFDLGMTNKAIIRFFYR